MNRRSFLGAAAAPLALAQGPSSAARIPHVDVLRRPDVVSLHGAGGRKVLTRSGELWQGSGVEVGAEPRRAGRLWEVPVTVSAPGAEVEHVCLRWRGAMSEQFRYLGDHWERSYGDLEWRAGVPERPMPWYFGIAAPGSAHAYGVKTGAAAVCFWQADPAGISLWLDLRNGGSGVRLGDRRLEAAVVRATRPRDGRTPVQTMRELCRMLCERPRLAAAPIYGGNNWYYTYGQNFGPADVLRDSEILAEATPAGESNRPFMVIDMGWNPNEEGAGPDSHGNGRFPDMGGLAAGIRQRGVRPGIWIRPLLTVQDVAPGWRLRPGGNRRTPMAVLDPSVPEVLENIRQSVRGIREWGFELIKHDFSTFDIYNRWGFQMGVRLTGGGWHFADRGRTTAEIVGQFYRALREAAGDGLLLGCNTIGHLGAGIFEAQRTGDDTSGREWERTRKMGVNTLAFRLPQHNAFFAADPDCVAITPAVPWDVTKQWLDLVARSGAALFVSADPAALGAEQKAALKTAFAVAARTQPEAEPLDWFETTAPMRWRFGREEKSYQWYGDEGASPFAG
jgi:alpha-galactosidase